MNGLNSYIQPRQSELFATLGAFFAFSNQQLNEQRQPGVEYVNLGAGLIAPKEHAKALVDGLSQIHQEGIERDLAANGKAAIIKRELYNHEAQITGDIFDTVAALDGYGITEAEVRAAYDPFYAECVKRGCF